MGRDYPAQQTKLHKQQNRNITAGKQPATPRMGYTRIEAEAGGRSACARREGEYMAQQGENGKERQRGAKPPMPRVPYKGSEGKEINEGRRGEMECMHAWRAHIVARGGDMERGRKGIYLRFERMAVFYRGSVEF